MLVTEGERRFQTERHMHNGTTETSDNGQPHPVYVNSATMRDDDEDDVDDDEEENLSELLIKQSSKRSKSKADGMMT